MRKETELFSAQGGLRMGCVMAERLSYLYMVGIVKLNRNVVGRGGGSCSEN